VVKPAAIDSNAGDARGEPADGLAGAATTSHDR